MTNDRDAVALDQIGSLFDGGATGGLTDGELLARFLDRDGRPAESAFAALVDRHGPMVLRVARSIVREPGDADDAFQAAFLVLARKADSLRGSDSLGPWLHAVTVRVAAGVRSAAIRRRDRERRVAGRPTPAPADPGPGDLGAILHEEIERLPDRYRAAVVLCLLEGLTQEQAADRLGWPPGTVRSRLARGRDRLRGRLTRRGLAPTAILTAASASTESVAAALAGSATRTALACRSGPLFAEIASATVAEPASRVMRSLAMSRIKIAALVGLAAVAGAAGARAFAPQKPDDRPPAAKAEPAKAPAVRWRYHDVQLGSISLLAETANAEAAKGWEVVQVVPGVINSLPQLFMLFRRPADVKD